MTEEEIKKLENRKGFNQKELNRLKEASKDFEYLLDSEKEALLKDVYYEHLLTQYEIDNLELDESEYSKELLKELESYRERLLNLSAENMHDDINKKIKKI